MIKEEPERIDDLGMKAWDDHDVDAFLGLLADEFVWRDITVPEPMTTREAARQYMLGWFTAFPDMRLTASNRVVGDDALAAELLFTGTNTGPLQLGAMQVPPTGKSVIRRGSYFVKVQDGRVTEFSTHPDAAGLMLQLGLTPQETPRAAR
jgi:steroid delta-isomerase-like uncharacterized protein